MWAKGKRPGKKAKANDWELARLEREGMADAGGPEQCCGLCRAIALLENCFDITRSENPQLLQTIKAMYSQLYAQPMDVPGRFHSIGYGQRSNGCIQSTILQSR